MRAEIISTVRSLGFAGDAFSLTLSRNREGRGEGRAKDAKTAKDTVLSLGSSPRFAICHELSSAHERYVLPADDTAGKRYAKPDTEDEEEKCRAGDPNDERACRTDGLEQQNRDHKKHGSADKITQRL
jgi:hypothetical protein